MSPEISPQTPEGRTKGELSGPVTRALLTIWAREGKWAEISLTGVSMSPLIPHGSLLTVRFGRLGLARGDVVLYATASRLIAHRVLRLGRRGKRWGFVKVKGDPVRPGEATWVPVEEIVGRVVAVRRPDGAAILLNTASGRLAGKVAAAISGTGGLVEASLRARLGLGRKLTITPGLLKVVAPLGRAGASGNPREAGLLLRAEERFLIAAAPIRMRQEDDLRLRQMLRREVPWERVIASASRLGLAPLLYRNLARAEFRGHVPAPAISSLARSAHGAACQMAIQLDALRSIVEALRTEEIDPVLLKGAALALTLYDQPSMRMMQDIDLLVPAKRVGAALLTLERLGYRGAVTDRGAEFYLSHHHATPMIAMGGRVVVEIHRGLVPGDTGLQIDPAPFIERAVRLGPAEASYRVLSPEDQILHAGLHLSYCDRFVGKLRDLMDLHALVEVRGGRLEWGRLLESAGRIEIARSLYSTLDLSRRLLGTPVPAEAMNELARAAGWDPLAERLLRSLARSSLFSAGPSDDLLPGPSARWMCGTLLRRARWSARLRALVQMLSEA